MKISALMKRHPVLAYFILVFIISWGGTLIVVGPGGIPGTKEQTDKLFAAALMMLLAGPITASLVLTGAVHGKKGFKGLLTRLARWRVEARWYFIAFLFTPLLVTAVLLALSVFSREFLPDIFTVKDKGSLLLNGVMVGIMGGLLEEIGWTGFAIPALRRRFGVLATGLIVGFLWGLWHFLVTFWASGDASGTLSLPLLLPPLLFYLVVLPVFRVLMVWVYDHTNSLLMAILMHTSLIGSTLFVLKPRTENGSLMVYYIILSAVIVLFISAVAFVRGGKLSRLPADLTAK